MLPTSRTHTGRLLLYLLFWSGQSLPSTQVLAGSSPVVGILSQPQTNPNNSSHVEYHYIAASYVKWLESAGARSIPIPYDASDTLVNDIFGQVNGILFPGGASDLPDAARRIWDLARRANEDEGDYFPLWGTCLGFEYLVMLAADAGESILQSGFDAENISLPLVFTNSSSIDRDTQLSHPSLRASKTPETTILDASPSAMFPPRIRHIASTQNVTMNNHQKGIEPKAFHNDNGLSSLFRVTTTSVDLANRPFVSTIEPQNPNLHPFYGVQFHPEKNNFEYGTYPGTNIPYEAINHSPDAVDVSLHLARFYVEKVRKNFFQSNEDEETSVALGGGAGQLERVETQRTMRQKTAAESEKRIRHRHRYTKPDQYPLVYSYEMRRGMGFEQVYVIPSAAKWEA